VIIVTKRIKQAYGKSYYYWIGCDVVIAPGTYIEEGSVIAMGTTVSGRNPQGSIAGVEKWRVLKTRDMDRVEALKAEGKFYHVLCERVDTSEVG